MRVTFALVACVAAIPLPAQSRAAEAFERAQELIADGKHAAGVAAYEKLAKQFPRTIEGQLAALRAEPNAVIGWSFLVEHGRQENRVDVVVMGDGYMLTQQNTFDDVAKNVPKIFEKHKVLGEYYAYHNFVRMNVRSREDGVDGFGREFDTALGGHVTGSVQGHVGVDSALVHQALAHLPSHDGFAIVFVKTGSHGTGGDGVAAIGGRQDTTVIHEWGHAFAALGDEYTNFTGLRAPVGGGAPNISAIGDPKLVPWKHMIEAAVPGVGVYRGGAGRLKGAWKPVASGCAMEGGEIFCPVCREAIVLRVLRYVDPIDACEPAAHKTAEQKPARIDAVRGEYAFEVEILQPTTHGLDVTWWVLTEQQVPRAANEDYGIDREQRGPLAPIAAVAAKTVRNARQRVQGFMWKPEREQVGRFRVVCRVVDDAKPAGRTPWVIADPRGLLVSERGWWIEVGQ